MPVSSSIVTSVSTVLPLTRECSVRTVVQCINSLDLGGAERLALTIAQQLDRHTFRSVICCMEERGALADEAERAGIEVHALRMQHTGKWSAFHRLCDLLRATQPGVIHSHNFKPFYYASLARLRGAASAHVHTRHGAFTREHRFEWRYRLLRPWADSLVTVSEDGRRKLSHASGLPLGKISVLPNGVDTTRFQPTTNKTFERTKLGLLKDCPAIANVARLSPEKDLPTLLRAFAILLRSCPNAELWIIGDGSERPMLASLSVELGIAAKTRFLGARNDVADILRAADVFALSSISEGLSVALIEAAASGLPIVATDVGGNREIIDPPNAGLVVPPRDPQALAEAMQRLLRDTPMRAALGVAARSRAIAHFSLQSMIDSYSQLYLEHVRNFR